MTLLQLFIRGVVVATFLLLAVVESVWTQAVSPASPVPAVPPGPASEGGAGQGLVAFIVVVGLLVLIGIVVKLYDMKRKREDEGVAMQARLSDALLMEPSFAGFPITPTVHVPLWRSSPAVVVMTGAVPTPELREAALRLVIREMKHPGIDYRIEDCLSVDTLIARQAA